MVPAEEGWDRAANEMRWAGAAGAGEHCMLPMGIHQPAMGPAGLQTSFSSLCRNWGPQCKPFVGILGNSFLLEITKQERDTENTVKPPRYTVATLWSELFPSDHI